MEAHSRRVDIRRPLPLAVQTREVADLFRAFGDALECGDPDGNACGEWTPHLPGWRELKCALELLARVRRRCGEKSSTERCSARLMAVLR
jgi:hypothetical protein